MSRLLAFLVLAGLPLAGQGREGRTTVKPASPAAPALRETFDVRYSDCHPRCTLDIFAPRGKTSERLPVVLYVHGGTWMFGDKNFFGINRGVGRGLASQGVVVVVINYRLSPSVKHPEHVKDVARAFAWSARHIGEYGGDPDRIVLAGHSAGAHLAALLATDESYLAADDLKLTARQRGALRGVVALSGVYRVPPPDEFRGMVRSVVRSLVGTPGPAGLTAMLTPTLRVVGESMNPFPLVFGTDRDVQTKASPLSHVRKGLPPFLLFVGESEVPGLKRMADDFAAALEKAHVPVSLYEAEGTNHRTILHRLYSDSDERRLVVEFVKKHAGPPARGEP
jgi:acetyl esterase/lipase